MNQTLALAEWRRAQQALRSAELLTRGRLYADAVARSYYALFHAAKALHLHDVAAQTHSAVRRMFSLHLIKPGAIETEWSKPLGESWRTAWRPITMPSYRSQPARHAMRAGKQEHSSAGYGAICSTTVSPTPSCGVGGRRVANRRSDGLLRCFALSHLRIN
jgi:uncharacterized protein (UPF0332 family)